MAPPVASDQEMRTVVASLRLGVLVEGFNGGRGFIYIQGIAMFTWF